MIELYKIVNDEFKFIDYGVKSKWQLYIKLGFMIKERIKRAVKKVKMTWDQFKESAFDMGVLVFGKKGEIKQVLLKGGVNG